MSSVAMPIMPAQAEHPVDTKDASAAGRSTTPEDKKPGKDAGKRSKGSKDGESRGDAEKPEIKRSRKSTPASAEVHDAKSLHWPCHA